MSNITTCKHCQARNRLGSPPAGQVPRCGRCKEPLPWLISANDADFNAAIDSPVPVLVDFWSPSCGPCLALTPTLENLANDEAGRLKVVKLDIGSNPLTAHRFQVQAVPLLVVIKDNEVVQALPGLRTKRELKSWLAPVLAA